MKRIIMIAGLMLAGCGTTTQTVVQTVTVDRPTPVSCVPATYTAPPVSDVTSEALLAAPDLAARYQLMARFWTAETPVLAMQAGVIAACQLAAKPSKP